MTTSEKANQVVHELRTVDSYSEEELRSMYRAFNESLRLVMKAIVETTDDDAQA